MIAGAHPLEGVTASDLFLLLWDDYGWSSDIGGLAVLDGPGLLDRDGRVRIGAVRDQLEPRLPLVPRFRQLLCRPGPPCCHTPGNSISITATADRDSSPDVEVFAQGVRSALDGLARSALVPAS